MSKKRTAEEAGLDFATLAGTKNEAPKSTSHREMQGSGADGKKHTIDSDEEEDYEKAVQSRQERMDNEDIEGQEDYTIERDGEIKITPFNLREEQEEGHFSKDGNFVWKKEKEIVDSWLDNVDWVKVKEMSAEETKKRDLKDEEEDEKEANYDEVTCYKECLKLMKEGETVAKAIRRLSGGKKPTPKWKKNKKKVEETPEEMRNRELMMKLTGFADSILSRSGNMEIYEETYEKIAYKIRQMQPEAPAIPVIPEGTNDDDALDMFAEDLDAVKETPKPEEEKEEALNIDDEVYWEFKWSKDDEEIHGPHSSKEMDDWQTSGFFDKGVFVRKKGSTGEFLDGKRIDFDIYT